MKKRVQILRWNPTECRWQFVAHGAPYTREVFETMVKSRPDRQYKAVALIKEL